MPRSDTKYDVTIVGAGPAGSWAAIELAGAGRSVLLVDRAEFPRQKACGGCLSGPATQRLARVAGATNEVPGTAVSRIEFEAGGYRLVADPRGATRMATRSVLDEWLAQRAAAAGAELRFGCAAQFEKAGERWAVRVGGELIQARHVLIACGLGRVPREFGIRNQCAEGGMVAQQWMEPLRQGLPRPGQIEMHWLRGGYIGLASPNADGCVVALAAERKAMNGHGPVESLRARNPHASIWERLASGADRHASSKGAAAFPWLPDRLGDGNVLLIGDAAGYAEPFSGTGIAQAMYSAECAAGAILGSRDVLKEYSRRMWRHQRVVCKTLRLSALLRTHLARVLLAKRIPRVAPWLGRLIERIHVRGSY